MSQFTTQPKRLWMIGALALTVGLATALLTFGLSDRSVEAENGETLALRFGEPQGSTLGRFDPLHLNIENPGPIDKKSVVTFDLNQLASTACPPSPTCDAFHQVIVMQEGVTVSDLGDIPDAQRYVFSGTGAEQPSPPADAGWLNPAVDALPANVLGAGLLGKDFTFEFQEKGTYLVLCNVRGHFEASSTATPPGPMYTYVVVDQINLNKP